MSPAEAVSTALEAWYLGLGDWRPELPARRCRWCAESWVRELLPPDIPADLVHALMRHMEAWIQEASGGWDASVWAALGCDPDEPGTWDEPILRRELPRHRWRIECAMDAFVRPRVGAWVAEATAHLLVQEQEGPR